MAMKTVKNYTDLEQSCKLVEILPLESADMYYAKTKILTSDETVYIVRVGTPIVITDVPCWSLAALFNILPDGTDVVKDKADTKEEKYMCTVGIEKDIITTFANNPLDVCYKMILKLHELKLL
jgi:hypothetical protein